MPARRPIYSEKQLTLDFNIDHNQLIHAWRYQVNLALLAVLAISLVGYIIFANQIVAKRYALIASHNQLNQLDAVLAQQNALTVSQTSLKELVSYAKNAGLVEAKEYDTIYSEPGLAAVTVFLKP